MGRYQADARESKFAWMRAKQEQRREQAARSAARHKPAAAVAPAARRVVESEMLRVKDVAVILGVSRQTVERWFARRVGTVVVQGRSNRMMLIPQQTLDDWIREHTNSR